MKSFNKTAMSDGQDEYMQTLAKWLLGAGMAGAAARGVMGIGEMATDNMSKDEILPPKPSVIHVPYKPALKGQEMPTNMRRAPKLAADKKAGLGSWAAGNNATTETEVPVGGLLNVLGGAAAGFGGWKGMGYLINKHRERMKNDELEAAKEQYEKSLLDQYKPLPYSKIKEVKMGSSPLADAELTEKILSNTESDDPKLTKLASSLEKLSNDFLERNLGSLAHHYGYVAGGLGLASGIGAYHLARDPENPAAMRAEQFKQEAAERAAMRPNAVYAKMVPVDDRGYPIPRKKLQQQYQIPDAHKLNLMNEPEKIARAVLDDIYGKNK